LRRAKVTDCGVERVLRVLCVAPVVAAVFVGMLMVAPASVFWNISKTGK